MTDCRDTGGDVLNRFRGLSGQGQYATSLHQPPSTPEHGPDLILQYVEFIDERICRCEMATMDMLKNAEIQHVDQCRRVSALTRDFERLLGVR